MEIIFRPMDYDANMNPDHRTLGYVRSLEADTISVTANPTPGSPLSIVVNKLNLDKARIHKAAVKSNRYSKIAVLESMSPRVILVPKTFGNQDVSELIDEMIESAKECGSEVINFTHYGHIKNEVPEKEVKSIFMRFAKKGPGSGIKVIVWDVDARHIQTFRTIQKTAFVVPQQ
jgi:hypothetical protein